MTQNDSFFKKLVLFSPEISFYWRAFVGRNLCECNLNCCWQSINQSRANDWVAAVYCDKSRVELIKSVCSFCSEQSVDFILSSSTDDLQACFSLQFFQSGNKNYCADFVCLNATEIVATVTLDYFFKLLFSCVSFASFIFLSFCDTVV